MIENLSNNNFFKIALNYYDNSQCSSIEEFNKDLNRFLYLKKLFTRYKNHSEQLNDRMVRLILNHIIIIKNCWGELTSPMLFLKVNSECWSILKTFLVFLDICPDEIIIDLKGINTNNIPLDLGIVEKLRKI